MTKPILFSGTSNQPLGKKLAKILNCPQGKITLKRFSDGEIYVDIKEAVQNRSVIILQSCSTPGNEYLIELLIIIDALKYLKPKKIIICLPFYPYRRQEKKIEKGESITARLVAKLLKTSGAQNLILLDLHSKKIEKFIKIPFSHLTALPLFVNYFKKKKLKNAFVVAPDQGAYRKNKALADQLKLSSTFIKKSRQGKHDLVEKMEIVGKDVKKQAIILDDEINTAGTLIKVTKLLIKKGVKNIYVAVTHPVLSNKAVLKLKKSPIKEIIVTDSIYLPPEKRIKKIKIISVAEILAQEIQKLTKN